MNDLIFPGSAMERVLTVQKLHLFLSGETKRLVLASVGYSPWVEWVVHLMRVARPRCEVHLISCGTDGYDGLECAKQVSLDVPDFFSRWVEEELGPGHSFAFFSEENFSPPGIPRTGDMLSGISRPLLCFFAFTKFEEGAAFQQTREGILLAGTHIPSYPGNFREWIRATSVGLVGGERTSVHKQVAYVTGDAFGRKEDTLRLNLLVAYRGRTLRFGPLRIRDIDPFPNAVRLAVNFAADLPRSGIPEKEMEVLTLPFQDVEVREVEAP